MLDLARRINAEEIAVREHIPDRKAIYVFGFHSDFDDIYYG